MDIIKINPSNIPFSLKTREMCKSCKRYGSKATCPPHVESVDYYKNVMRKYNNGRIFYKKFEVTDNWQKEGKESSLFIHKTLLAERDRLFNLGVYFINIFGAGSCKMCDQCSFPCRHPNKSIIPIEATGVDVVKLMDIHGIKITFPITDTLYRIGMVLYD